VLSTYNSLTKSNKSSLRDIIREIEPEKGPWDELLTLLCNCDEAFNESSAAITAKGLPLNRIACISHILCDEKFLACIIPLSDVPGSAAARPADLDQIKATGKTKIDVVYAEVHKSYKTWIKDYKNPFLDGQFSEDLGAIRPHLATFKDGAAVRSLVPSTVQKVETILKNHKQSGHHSSGDDRLLEIRNSFITNKGKNLDMGTFYAFLILEDKDLKFGVLVLNPCHMFLQRRVKLLLKESSFVSRSKRNIISMCWHLMFTMMKKKRKRKKGLDDIMVQLQELSK